MINIVDDIGKVVQSIRNGGTYVSYNGNDANGSPYFDAGHRLQIVNNLTNKGQQPKSQSKKFPLIALKTDIVEICRGNVVDFNLNIAIAVSTKTTYSEFDRLNNNFIPVLYPLLVKFKQAFTDSGLGFFWLGELDFPPCAKIDRAYYGIQDGQGNSVKNIFNEPVDAIEIINMKFSKQDFSY